MFDSHTTSVSGKAAREPSSAPAVSQQPAWHVGFNWRTAGAGVVVAASYYLGAKLGFALTFQPHPVSVMWPPNSILLAALLLTPVRTWWFLLLAAFPAHWLAQLQSNVPAGMILSWFISNSCEALIGAGFLRYFIRGPIKFDSLRTVGLFCVGGGFLGPFLSSFLDAGFVILNRWGEGGYWELWRIRLFSNVLTALTVAAGIVSWSAGGLGSLRHASRWRRLEAGFVFLGLLAVGFSVFVLYEVRPDENPALLYAPLPFMLWAAVRFGSRGAGAAVLLVALLAIWGAAHGHGPFSGRSPEENARSIQLFLIVSSVLLLLLAAAVEERRKAAERFVKAFRSSPDAIMIKRRSDFHIIEVNERWEELFGYRREEAIGRTASELNLYLSKADRARLIARNASDGGSVRDLEMPVCTRTGEVRQALFCAEVVDLAGERCLIVIIRDITDRKRIEEASRNLAHSSRLAMVGELTAMIAHEVNQPLSAILSNVETAEMLLDSSRPRLEEIRHILADVRDDDLRASEAIRRIRTLLRRRPMELQTIDLNDLVADVLHFVTGDAQIRRIELQTELAARLPAVNGDRAHVEQVLLNLLLNGMDALADIAEGNRRLLVRTASNGAMVEVSVSDNAHGIDPARLEQVFDSFFTTKKNGMGLGLSIARSIIESHQGKIWADNNPRGGATFRFTLPAVSQSNGE
jgi:two-component system sensor kinase FixL